MKYQILRRKSLLHVPFPVETISFMRSLVLFTLLCLNKLCPCNGIDMITQTQSLSGDQTLVSAGEVFELGFFKPGKSERYDIGIWYKQVSPRTVIWVASRYAPVSDKFSSELKISEDGELVMVDRDTKKVAWSNYVSSAHPSSVNAILLDEGNLVLLPNDSSSPFPAYPPPIWQSFDWPGNNWIPGVRIGFNKVTSKEVLLTNGPFSVRLGANRSLEWEMSSNIMPSRISAARQILELNFTSNFVYVENLNESYFTFIQY